METKIIKQEKNPFLRREELEIEIISEATPTKEEVKKSVGSDEEKIVVKKIENSFGKHSFVAEVFVYESKEDKERAEIIPKKIRKKLEEERKAAEEAAKKAEEEKKKAEEAAKEAEAKEENKEDNEVKEDGN